MRLELAASALAIAIFLASTSFGEVEGPQTPLFREIIHNEGIGEPPQAPLQMPEGGAAQGPVPPVRGPFLTRQVNVDSAGKNITGDAANEPSLTVNPLDHNRMAIGWRQFDTIQNNFRQAGWAWSEDAGRNWTFPGRIQPGVFRSDPVLGADADGTFYYCSLRGDFTVRFFKSFDGGKSWGPELTAFGGDKQWFTIDRTGGVGHGNIYTSWNTAAGCCGTRIFSRSTDGANSWSQPQFLPNNPIFGTLCVGTEGELYIVGIASVPFNPFLFPLVRSTNARDADETPEFDLETFVDLGGPLNVFAGASPNPGGLLGQVWIACDHSQRSTRGNVYVLSSIDPPGPDPLDVFITRSEDRGETWSAPVRVNDDGINAWQWFGTLSVAPDGRLDVFWNDTRNDSAGAHSELYYAYSQDGGRTWSANRAVGRQFNNFLGYPQQNKLGDYYHAVSDNAGVDLAHAATQNGEQDVYHLRLNRAYGDGDSDGDTDLSDFQDFASCTSAGDAGCESFDSDLDGDIDLLDFGAMQSSFAGDCAPKIIVQPKSASSCFGGSADFSIEASGDDLTYQWHRNGLSVPGGDGPALTISSANSASAGAYAVTVQSDCATATSEVATLSVAGVQQIIDQPDDVLSCLGQSVDFSITVSGGVEPLSYQWYFNGVDISGATDLVLTVEGIGPEDVGAYRCRVTDGCDVSIFSASADLSVSETVFTMQPMGDELCEGEAIFLTAAAANNQQFQWRKDGQSISGETSSFLFMANATTQDSGVYTVEAAGMCITVLSDPALIEVSSCADRP